MPPLCTECPLCAGPGRVSDWVNMDGDVPKKDTQDWFLAKRPYKGSDLHSFTACFLYHSEAIHSLCCFAIRGLALLGSVLLSGCWGWSVHLPEFFFLSHKEVNLTVRKETPALRLESSGGFQCLHGCVQQLSEPFLPCRCWKQDELLCGFRSEWPCPLPNSASCGGGKWGLFQALPCPPAPALPASLPPLLAFCILTSLRPRSQGPNSKGRFSLEFFWKSWIGKWCLLISI